jgi:transcriptional regulator with XRE-family HTH domain
MTLILKAIRKAIRESGKSRYAIAKAVDIDQGHFSKLMKGQAGLSLENVEKLAEYLDLEIIVRKKGRSNGKHQS